MIDNSVMFVGESGDTPCGYYRCQLPAKGLQQHGWTVQVCNAMVETELGLLRGFNGKQLLPAMRHVVCRRLNEPLPGTANDSGVFQSAERMISRARKAGQSVYIDLDDDPFTLPEWNPAYGNMSDYDLELWLTDMQTCDNVIVSTPQLRESLLRNGKLDAAVCRNGIDRSQYRYKRTETTPLRLAWLGTLDYRERDLRTIANDLCDALDGKFGEVEFWHLGADITGKRNIFEVFEDDYQLAVQVRQRPWVNIERLPQALANVDCAVIPMQEHDFNRARSAVTGLACAAAGVAFAGADWQPEYQRLWKMGAGYPYAGDALKVLTGKEYAETRIAMRTTGYGVAELHSPKRTAEQYIEVFTESP